MFHQFFISLSPAVDSGESLEVMEETQTPFVPKQQQAKQQPVDSATSNKSTAIQQIEINVKQIDDDDAEKDVTHAKDERSETKKSGGNER